MALRDWLKAYVRHQTGQIENAAHLATGALAEIPAGLAGIAGLVTGGADKGGNRVRAMRERLTYQPRSNAAKAQMASIARLVAPVTSNIEKGRTVAGDWALKRTGSPLAATAVSVLPEALLTLSGAPAASRGLSTASQIAKNAARMEAPAMGSPAAQLGIFAGANAATADVSAMNRAASRLALGADPREVWRTEGWFRGPDGQMRFEIDDSQSRLTGIDPHQAEIQALKEGGRRAYMEKRAELADYTQPYRETDTQPLENVFEHRELADAYPVFEEAIYRENPEMGIGTGSYDSRWPMVQLGPQDPATARSTILHELQHDVQNREGFARGGNTSTARRALEEQMSHGGLNLELYDDHSLYQRLAGEAEARAVQKRMDYTPQQRRDIYPLDDYDVPLDELIIRGNR